MTGEPRKVLQVIPIHADMTDDELRDVIRQMDIPQAAIDRLVRAVIKVAMEAEERDGAA